jgi:hypothetical protein
VRPFALLRGLTQEDMANIEANEFSERLTLYVSEAGLPVRTIDVEHAGRGANAFSDSATTDILAVNIALHVKAPSVRKTIGERRFDALLRKHGKELGREERAISGAINTKSA